MRTQSPISLQGTKLWLYNCSPFRDFKTWLNVSDSTGRELSWKALIKWVTCGATEEMIMNCLARVVPVRQKVTIQLHRSSDQVGCWFSMVLITLFKGKLQITPLKFWVIRFYTMKFQNLNFTLSNLGAWILHSNISNLGFYLLNFMVVWILHL